MRARCAKVVKGAPVLFCVFFSIQTRSLCEGKRSGMLPLSPTREARSIDTQRQFATVVATIDPDKNGTTTAPPPVSS